MLHLVLQEVQEEILPPQLLLPQTLNTRGRDRDTERQRRSLPAAALDRNRLAVKLSIVVMFPSKRGRDVKQVPYNLPKGGVNQWESKINNHQGQ